MDRSDLPKLLHEALVSLGGNATPIVVFRYFWEKHELILKKSGDIYYTWNYDIRWAATELRKKGIMKPVYNKSQWELSWFFLKK